MQKMESRAGGRGPDFVSGGSLFTAAFPLRQVGKSAGCASGAALLCARLARQRLTQTCARATHKLMEVNS